MPRARGGGPWNQVDDNRACVGVVSRLPLTEASNKATLKRSNTTRSRPTSNNRHINNHRIHPPSPPLSGLAALPVLFATKRAQCPNVGSRPCSRGFCDTTRLTYFS
ncbi:hypothetical protein CRV24_005067 [Beauveria bassiana]|nr:hypothetical protein CRV24_005067 [Beauveria bassiana]